MPPGPVAGQVDQHRITIGCHALMRPVEVAFASRCTSVHDLRRVAGPARLR
ncbi:hypothetical protein BTZ20_1570 [Rhodococcus sp. MTM3W5.2]|nr:hypothetical protein BTZ20_1570 [Rhodococcus sp. MTM3W5.2]